MTRVLIISSFALFFSITARAQGDWKKYKIDDALSVKFPGVPKQLSGHDVFFKEPDSTAYFVYVEDFSDMTNLDGEQLTAKENTIDLANAVKDDLMNRMPGYMLGNVIIGKWKNYTCYHISGGNAKDKRDMYVYVLFIGINGYYLITTLPANHQPDKKDVFFDSVNQ